MFNPPAHHAWSASQICGTLTKCNHLRLFLFLEMTTETVLSDPSCSERSDCVHTVTFYSTCDQFDPTLLKLIRGLSQESRWTEEPCSVALPSFPGHYGHKASQHGYKQWRRTSINGQCVLPALEHATFVTFLMLEDLVLLLLPHQLYTT